MYIKKLELKNFKCYSEIEFEFGEVNVISGKNSSGKSTIIQSILIFNNSINKELLDLQNMKNINLIGFKEVLNQNEENAEEFSVSINSNIIEYKEAFSDNNRPINNICTVNTESNLKTEDLKVIYLGAERTLSSIQIPKIQSKSYIPNSNNEHLADYLYINDQGLRPNSIKKKLEKYLIDLEFINEKIDIRPSGRVYQLLIDNKEVEHVGVGVKYVIPLLLSALSNENSVIIIENPEIHMHPRAQTKLISQLVEICKNNNNQLVFETHSDHVINEIRLQVKNNIINNEKAKIYFIGDQVQVREIEIDSSGKLNRRVDGFFDEFEKQLGKLLW